MHSGISVHSSFGQGSQRDRRGDGESPTSDFRSKRIDENYMEEFQGQIGIDLGTTYSCVGVWLGDHVEIIANEKGHNTIPSWVSFAENEILIGQEAKEQANLNPKNTIFDVKRLIGKRFSDESVQADLEHFPFEVVPDRNDLPLIKVNYKGQDRTFMPEQISAMILTKMREIAEARLGQRVKKAVITVPAYFNDSQRSATKNAAIIAGLECDKIVNEPTAACLCYGLDRKDDGNKVLIFDLGGGTFDVSILNLQQGVFEVLSTSGDTHLGGEDFDNIIMEKIMGEFSLKHKIPMAELIEDVTPKALKKLKLAAESAKRSISVGTSSTIEVENFYKGLDLIAKLTRAKFESWCNHLFLKCLEPVTAALKDAKMEADDIDEIVLVGGSTRIPKVQELLRNYFRGKTLNQTINPDEAVAYGAAVQGAILSKTDTSGKTKDLLLLDVTPLSLGIESKGGLMSIIIERNSQIPIKKSKVYTTVDNHQASVMIQIFEGERKFTKDNHKIGDFELTDIPDMARGVPKVEVKFNIDANGILTVSAYDKDTGNVNEIKITDSTRLTQEEINRMVDEAEEFRADDELRKEALNCRYTFEKELSFTQQSINDPELNTDDTGIAILTEDEIMWVNQFVLNNLTWLENDEDLSKGQIDEAKRQFLLGVKPLMSKIFARKKQLDMARQYRDVNDATMDQEKNTEQVQNLVNDLLGEKQEPVAHQPSDSMHELLVKPKKAIKVAVKIKT